MRFARGVREFFLNGAFWCIFGSDFVLKKLPFFRNKKNILDTVAMRYISHKEIFENILRMMCFGVYFE